MSFDLWPLQRNSSQNPHLHKRQDSLGSDKDPSKLETNRHTPLHIPRDKELCPGWKGCPLASQAFLMWWCQIFKDNKNNNNLLQLGCHPVAVVILHVYKR